MALDIGGGSKTSQTQTQQQIGVQDGTAYGAASGKGSVGGGSTGNITGGLKVAGVFTQVNTMTDHGAIQYSHELSMAALQENQKLSTLAVGYANQNANQALQALQAIGTQAQVAAAGGSAAEVAGATTTTGGTVGQIADTKQILIFAGLATLAFLAYRYAR